MKIDHVAINVENIARSVAWYVENFSAIVSYSDETWAMLEVGEFKIALTIRDQHPPHLAFRVETFDDESNVRAHRDGAKYIYKTDPDGNTIELINYD
jgi:catechol 2,3-dioxygenase-like lactoylglutathione lyase family enzyme